MVGSKKSERTFIGTKSFQRIITVVLCASVLLSLIAVCFPGMFSVLSRERTDTEYPIKLFGRNVIDIDITVDETVWSQMLENKMSKPYISCDISIDGKEFKSVGLRSKGNSSLTSIRGDRISYRLDFDHYIDNQTCYGLEQMVLNNLQADATYMKDFIAYDLMEYMGVKAPLHTYAFISINGEPFGLYLAVEVYDEDYLERTFGNTRVQLYNVKSSGLDEYESALVDPETAKVLRSDGIVEASSMGGPGQPPPSNNDPNGFMSPPPEQGNGSFMQGGQPANGQPPMIPQDGNRQPPQGGPGGEPDGGFGGGPGGPGGGPGGAGGGDLVYVDGSTESYNEIFANAVSKNADAEDFAKVIRAIYYLNRENVTTDELETYWDVDAALRYLAVHAFMVNGDSYTGNMKQNFYLAEENGRITILPWDYNLSFGAFSGGPGGSEAQGDKTTTVINHAIDTPVIDAEMPSRPLVSVLLGNEEYKNRYHAYLEELTAYVQTDFIDRLEIFEKDIRKQTLRETERFYTPEEQNNAFEVLKKYLSLRCESIDKQLRGEIASETALQTAETLITGDFSVDEMGSMGGGGGPGGPGGPGGRPGDMSGDVPNGMPGGAPPNMPPDMIQMQNGDGINITFALFLLLLLIGMLVGVKAFKRNY